MASASLAFYGDSIGAEVYAIDVDRMALAARIPTGAGPYPVDRVDQATLFAVTRGEASITPIDLASLTARSKIALPHKPRSASPAKDNPKGLALVSGADKPLTSVIDLTTGAVVRTVGRDTADKPSGFGGTLASGHERSTFLRLRQPPAASGAKLPRLKLGRPRPSPAAPKRCAPSCWQGRRSQAYAACGQACAPAMIPPVLPCGPPSVPQHSPR